MLHASRFESRCSGRTEAYVKCCTERAHGSLFERVSCLLNAYEFCTHFSFIINAVRLLRFNLIRVVRDALVLFVALRPTCYDVHVLIRPGYVSDARCGMTLACCVSYVD